jgi:hypothetical protein
LTFISIPVTEDIENKAKQIRLKRDSIYKNIYKEENSDIRWIGEVGEICFNNWLQQNLKINFEWITENVVKKPDFIINNIGIGVKTVKRQVPPQLHYTAQITAKHLFDEPSQGLFFISYEFQIKKLWLLGGISKIHFIKNAKYYGEGECVHQNYKIRKGHEIYNIDISKLIPPDKWIEYFN